tara:strand:+ start:137 stop:607 length:471 start_codon:yes stop_codon:yes gene_type:complete
MQQDNESYENYMLRRSREEALKDKMRTQLTNSTRMIWVTFQKEGIHKYPAALDDPKLATGDWDDVSYLGYPHRHMFHFKVSIEVFHDDREIEFIQFSRWLQRLFSENVMTLDYKSCEMIADEMFVAISTKYGSNRDVHIEVSEDGENGCVVTFPKA